MKASSLFNNITFFSLVQAESRRTDLRPVSFEPGKSPGAKGDFAQK